MGAELADRRYLSRYSTEQVGATLYVGGQPTDADGAVQARLYDPRDDHTVGQRAATHFGPGQYGITTSGLETQTPGPLDLALTYQLGGVGQLTVVYLEVGPSAPAYDGLPPGWRAVVDSVWSRFADLYDSPFGGPFLQTPAQTSFGRGRLASLLRVAVGRLNTVAQPQTTYSVDGDFPFAQWGPLAEQALYVEMVRHLIRSYVEQPEVQLGSSVSRLDRRDYMQRWQEVLADAQADLKAQLDGFKIAMLGLGNSRVLVSGGAYGRLGANPYLPSGTAAARGYFPGRFFG